MPPARQPRLLITGAAGKFGRQLISGLRDTYELVLTDVQSGEYDGLPIHALDICDFEQTRAMMEGVELVVHMAIGNPHLMDVNRPQWARDDELMQVGVHGTQHVFEAAHQAGARRVVFGSSLTVYPYDPNGASIGPDTPTRPRNLYACTKLFGEEVAALYAREYGLTSVCLRFGQPYPLPRILPDPYRIANAAYRRYLLGWDDMVQSVRCALDESGPSFAIANITSANDAEPIDPLDGPRLGYRPTQFFTAEGCTTALKEGTAFEQ